MSQGVLAEDMVAYERVVARAKRMEAVGQARQRAHLKAMPKDKRDRYLAFLSAVDEAVKKYGEFFGSANIEPQGEGR